MPHDLNVESAVQNRYGKAANSVEPALCCPIEYDRELLEVLPSEIIDKDYGCGDPSKFVQKGEIVLDLGSGSGKICYMASQITGSEGRVIGVDTNIEMLRLATKYKETIADEIGWSNVEFRYGNIQDLQTDLTLVDDFLGSNPIHSSSDLEKYTEFLRDQKEERPLIESGSIDLTLSNCVLNLVRPEDKRSMFSEMFRVLKKGGRVAISDIVSDEDVPEHLRNNPELWSGCISGAYREDLFLKAFTDAGFYGVEIVKRDPKPWQTVEGIEFRSVTVTAYKGKEGPCLERNQAVIYKGPWKKVLDDDGHALERGRRTSVCDKTFKILSKEPYLNDIIPVEPICEVPEDEAAEFDCSRAKLRDPRETKGMGYSVTATGDACGPDGDCC